MLTNEEKREYREELFRHLDGIAVAPVAYAFKEKGVLDFILKEKSCILKEISEKFSTNEGYLNVGLRMLASQGWIDYEIDASKDQISISKNENSEIAFTLIDRYKDVVDFMKVSEEFHPRHFEMAQFSIFNKILIKYINNTYAATSEDPKIRNIELQIATHIEGVLVGPITVFLGMDGMFHKYFMEASFSADEFHEDPISFSKILDFFTFLGWFIKKKEHYRFTNKGLFFARRSSAYGVPSLTFQRLDA